MKLKLRINTDDLKKIIIFAIVLLVIFLRAAKKHAAA